MDDIIKKYNMHIRKGRPLIIDEDNCEIFQTDSVLEISLSRGICTNDAKGTCIMCNYGITSRNRPIANYLNRVKLALEQCNPTIDCLMLCTNGSIFDEQQIEPILLNGVIDLAAQCKIPKIEFETYYQDITLEKLQMLRTRLPNKEIIISMGLETANPIYQDYIIGKNIILPKLEEKIDLVKNMDFQVELNVMLGLPFLSTKEQFFDACNTIKWVFSHGCRPVLFPINIKPYSLLNEMYIADFYSPISQWFIVLVLNTLTATELSQVIIVWYGNRVEDYGAENLKPVFPSSCNECKVLFDTFYSNFNSTKSGNKRIELVKNLLQVSACDCCRRTQQQIEIDEEKDFCSRYESFIDYIKERRLPL